MMIHNIEGLILAAIELGKCQGRPVEFSGMLLGVLLSEETTQQLVWIHNIACRASEIPKVEQCENYDGIRVVFKGKEETEDSVFIKLMDEQITACLKAKERAANKAIWNDGFKMKGGAK